jgi:hypothetical protein
LQAQQVGHSQAGEGGRSGLEQRTAAKRAAADYTLTGGTTQAVHQSGAGF